ncbi:MAG: tetratricopeptide repeat protein [Candidatus Gracilibacteria bacterium]|nr:tetratricopeptide repeat protein [Candidatus Gracilibacteria bacterium]
MNINKTKVIIGIFTALFIISGGLIVKDIIFPEYNDDTLINKNKNLIEEIDKLEDKKQENINTKDKKKAALEKIRNRYSLRGIIIKGDLYNKQNEPDKALKQYLNALEKLPSDEAIIKKIADLYFNKKDFKNAYEYYLKIKDSENAPLDKLVLSLIYGENLDSESSLRKLAFLIKQDFPLDSQSKFYYMNSLGCLNDFHLCKKNFNTYFEKNENITDPKLLDIKNAIQKYRDFKIDEIYYKDTLLTASFFENGMYPISANLGEQILEKKPNYQSVMQIIGKSYYELQNFEKAREILEDSYELDTNNPKISYLLGIINFELKDYESSSLYFNAAIKSGYTPKEDLERRLAYNYYILEQTENMLTIFKYLLDEENSTISDFSLGIYHAITNDKKTMAIKWANKAKEKFPDEEIFYGYLGWIYRELGQLDLAQQLLEKGLEKNSRNPLITLNLGYLYQTKGDYENAEKYFRKTYIINSAGEFGLLAKNELKELENFTNK